ncbi:MAG: molecular chaperone TorD family protein [Thermoanaerobaculia bacterium]
MEVFRALASLIEPTGPESQRLADLLELGPLPDGPQLSELFLFQLYPYASIYLGSEGMMGGEARDRIAGFWRALALDPPAEPDHLAVMLALYARLAELEDEAEDGRQREAWRQARRAFLWEHLLCWLPPYLAKLTEIGPPFYRRWAEQLTTALGEETEREGLPEQLPLHLREAPGPAHPDEEGGRAFLQSLLSPVRSGLIFVRADFHRAARELGLGVRLGERRFVLETLMSQDAGATLDWLRGECDLWIDRHRHDKPSTGMITTYWTTRAKNTRQLLEEIRTKL